MLIYVPVAIGILLLIILFRYLPRRIFLLFVALLVLLGGVIFRMETAERDAPPLTQEARAVIAHDQDLFLAWWSTYQKQLAELDRAWTRCHQILADAKTGEVSLAITHARLTALEQEMQELRARMEKNAPPTELSDHLYDQLALIAQKTGDYAAAEQKAVTLMRAAADPAAMREQKPAEQARLIELVLLRESPVALFVADEVSAMRSYFAPISASHAAQESAQTEGEHDEKLLDK